MKANRWGSKWLTWAVCGLLCVQAVHATEKSAPSRKQVIETPDSGADATRSALRKLALKSSAALVIDANTADVIYSKQSKVPSPVASITKLMTALVVLDAKQSLDEKLTITRDDRDNERGSGSRLAIGAKLSRGDLMHLALMSSENRAAHALGRNYPGGLAKFVPAMNAKAKALGMKNTYFVDPTGLSSRNVASPEDLANLVVAASRSPTLAKYSVDPKYVVRVGKGKLEFRNTNLLVNNPEWDITVQKTGFINEAGKCLVMQADIGGRPVVIVLLNSFGKYTRTADARRIRKWMEGELTASRSPVL